MPELVRFCELNGHDYVLVQKCMKWCVIWGLFDNSV